MTYSITHDTGETFTFEDGMIESVSTSTSANEPDENVLPGTGPMGNEVYDFGGAVKVIVVRGKLYETNSSVTDSVTITSILHMKYWLESLVSAAQGAKAWVSPTDTYSLFGGGSTTAINSVNIPGSWLPTTVYVMAVEFPDETEYVGNLLPFVMTLKVAGF